MKAAALVVTLLCSSLSAQLPAGGGTAAADKKATELLFRFAPLPAEYRADLYLGMYNNMSGQLSAEMSKRLLEVSFLAGRRTHYPTMIEYAAKSPESAASQSFRNLVNQRLDGLDIQAQVVTLALPGNPGYAADTLGRIKFDAVRSTCKDPSVISLDRYYEAEGSVLKNQNVSKIGAETKSEFFSRSVREVQSPAQLAPLLKILTSVGPEPYLLQEYTAQLSDKMQKIHPSDREMIAVLQPMAAAVPPFVAMLVKNGVSPSKFLQAYRSFLVEGLSGQECSDLSANRNSAVKSFATLLAQHPTQSISALTLSDLKPSGKGPSAEDPQIQMDDRIFPPLQRLYALKQARLAAAQKGLPVPDEQTNPADVRAVIEYALSPKSDSSACAECRFGGPVFAFFSLINTLPSGQDLERSVDAYIDFLSHNHIEEEDPPAFLVALKQVVNIARPVSEKGKQEVSEYLRTHKGAIGAPSEEAEFVRKELLRSTDPMIKAYVVFEDAFHPSYVVPSQTTR